MNCPKCGTQNESENAFCVMCGASLKREQANTETNNNVNEAPVSEPVVTNEAPVTPVVNTTPEPAAPAKTPAPVTPVAPVTNNQTMNNVKNVSYNAFKYILNTLKSPYKNYTRNEETLSNTKNSFILAGIMSVVMMLATLLATIIDTILVKKYSTKGITTAISFEGLKELDWVSLLLKNLIIYAVVILAIAGVYYIISLILKKKSNFIKQLSIAATSVIPYTIGGLLLSPILSNIWSPLSTIVTVAGAVYSILIVVELMNKECGITEVEDKIRFQLINLTIIGSGLMILYSKLLASAVTSSLSSTLDSYMNFLK